MREAHQGETEGRKDRPVAVGVRVPRADGDLLLLFPITTKEPEATRFASEIPLIEKRRAGLDPSLRLWIVLDEYNTDVVGQSYYLEPELLYRLEGLGINTGVDLKAAAAIGRWIAERLGRPDSRRNSHVPGSSAITGRLKL